MVKPLTEAEIASRLEKVLRQTLAEAGSGLRLLGLEAQSKVGKATADAVAKIGLPGSKQKPALLLIEVKARGEPFYLSQAITQLKTYREAAEAEYGTKREIGLLVVAPYVSDRGRELCKSQGVGYVDLAGNLWLRVGNHSLDKMGRDNPAKERQELRTLFSPKASRILRALLIEPRRTWTISELAKETGVSLGLAHKVVKKLEAELFLNRGKNVGVSLDRPAELLDAWTANYRVSDHERHDFYSFQRNPNAVIGQLSEVAQDEKLEYALTSHAGASLVAPFVRFSETQLYVRKENLESWAERLDLRPVESGANVALIVPRDEGVFYGTQTVNGATVVSNVQLYLDLVKHPGRGEEQAEFLRKEKLKY